MLKNSHFKTYRALYLMLISHSFRTQNSDLDSDTQLQSVLLLDVCPAVSSQTV